MSAVGERLWRFVQDWRPRYTQSALAEDLSESGLYQISSQSVSNYLRREYPPVPFLNATAKFLRLNEAQKEELRRVYFHDAALKEAGSTEIEEVDSGWQERRKDDPVPDEPGTTRENEAKLQAERERMDRRDEEKRREREESNGGGRIS